MEVKDWADSIEDNGRLENESRDIEDGGEC